MSQRQAIVNHCDICGHEWIPKHGVTYTHCTSGKCRSRRWNSEQASIKVAGFDRETSTVYLESLNESNANVPPIVVEKPQELKGEWEFPPRIEVSKEELERGYIERNACPDCGSLVGHQKWCRGNSAILAPCLTTSTIRSPHNW